MQKSTPRSATPGTRGISSAAETPVATSAPEQFSVSVKPSSRRLILTLGIAGLLSGLAIVGIYELTLGTITGNQNESLRAAVRNVLPGATRFQPLRYANGGSVLTLLFIDFK